MSEESLLSDSEFCAWLTSVDAAARKATDPDLMATERRKWDRILSALTTPGKMLDMVSYVREKIMESS